MSVERDEVLRIARLARLELDGEEADALADELGTILEHMEKLAGVSTDPPGEVEGPDGSGPAPLRDGRTDRPDPLRRPPGELAPGWRDGFFVVPRLPAVEGRDGDVEEPPEEETT